MVTIPKNKAPFGSYVKRFGNNTAHPGLDSSGFYSKRPEGCDPCIYSPKPLSEVFRINRNRINNKDPWRYKAELEDWSKNLGYRNQKALARRKWFKSILGPAWHEISEVSKYEPACKNLGFGRVSRDRLTTNNIPGPGTYYKRVSFKAPHESHSVRPTFEREEPCRFKDTSKKWSLAPNRYNIIDQESIELKTKKAVSLRGPYDIFTGKRDESTIKNHFSTSLRCSAATWPIALGSTLNKYKNSHMGEMNKTNRSVPYRGRNTLVDMSMCIRKAEDPGPAHYNTRKFVTFKQNKYGFNSSYDKPPGYKRVVVWPAVGRYTIKNISCGIIGQGHRHDFLSKQKRTIGAILPEPMNSF